MKYEMVYSFYIYINTTKCLPTISTTRNVSIIGSIISSGIRDNLLFWIFNVSNELRFSKDDAGKADMLKIRICSYCLLLIIEKSDTHSFFCKFKNVMESP